MACIPSEITSANSCEADSNINVDNNNLDELREFADIHRRFEAYEARRAEMESNEVYQSGLRNIRNLRNTLHSLLVNNDLEAVKRFCEEHQNDGEGFWIDMECMWESFCLGNNENPEGVRNEASEELGKAIDLSGVGRWFTFNINW